MSSYKPFVFKHTSRLCTISNKNAHSSSIIIYKINYQVLLGIYFAGYACKQVCELYMVLNDNAYFLWQNLSYTIHKYVVSRKFRCITITENYNQQII